jgi:UDP-N-acetylmuramoylalanine--D-glutamate ligase
MKPGDWSGQKVVIIGAARQGLALARYLTLHGAQVVLNDFRPAAELQVEQNSLSDLSTITWVLGAHPLSLLEGAQTLCISGGVPLNLPLVVEAQKRGLLITNDSQIFLEAAPCKVIGITGSAGKTTTTTLVGLMAQQAFQNSSANAWIGGNIGSPLIASVDEMQPADLAVMELSSFQLEIMTRSPQLGAVLNITPNHLDRHGTMEAYLAAKGRILDFQSLQDVAVLGRDDPIAWSLAGRAAGQVLSFGMSELPPGQSGTFLKNESLVMRQAGSDTPLMPRSRIHLRGDHNLLNVLAACAIAAAAGFSPQAMQRAVDGFYGIQHRLEFVRRWNGADWYNDSIATAPERAMAAINSFSEPLVLLTGGRDKNLPWEDFAALVCRRVDHLVLFGEAAEKIDRAIHQVMLIQAGRLPTVQRCAGLHEAVQAAAQIVEPGDVVLLSPGGTSFDEFKDFEERGACFVQWVKELT